MQDFFRIFARFCKREWGYGGNAVAKGQIATPRVTNSRSLTQGTRSTGDYFSQSWPSTIRLIPFFRCRTLKLIRRPTFDSAQAYVGEELRFVDRVDGFDGFHFDNDTVLND